MSMSRLKVEDLDRIKEEIQEQREESKGRVIVHMGTCGRAAGADEIMKTLREEQEAGNLDDVILTKSGCAGLCSREPMVTVEMRDKDPVKYVDLTPEKIKEILKKHVIEGNPVKEYALSWGRERVL